MVKTVNRKQSETICEIIRYHLGDLNETKPIYWDYPYTPPEEEIRHKVSSSLIGYSFQTTR